ncbi:MAG: hypothetical protein JNJ83_22000 [Verrucomicrobiaceae bacterium]|nr:hypothetical protein [Verrucomicrobiaceae bacterium]
MKLTSSLLLVLALSVTAQAGLITDPLSNAPVAPLHPVLAPGGAIGGGLATDPLGATAPTPAKTKPSATIDFTQAKKQLNELIGASSDDKPLLLRELMQVPALRDALHAQGPEADALRGYMDWLLLTGVVVGLDGDDGLDDLTGDPDDGVNLDQNSAGTKGAANSIILGGPGSDNLQPLVPHNPSIMLGQSLHLAGDSQDHNPDIADD